MEGCTEDNLVRRKDKRLALIKCTDFGRDSVMDFIAVLLFSMQILISFVPTANDCYEDCFNDGSDKG